VRRSAVTKQLSTSGGTSFGVGDFQEPVGSRYPCPDAFDEAWKHLTAGVDSPIDLKVLTLLMALPGRVSLAATRAVGRTSVKKQLKRLEEVLCNTASLVEVARQGFGGDRGENWLEHEFRRMEASRDWGAPVLPQEGEGLADLAASLTYWAKATAQVRSEQPPNRMAMPQRDVFNLACEVWTLVRGSSPKESWDPIEGRLRGLFPQFFESLVEACGLGGAPQSTVKGWFGAAARTRKGRRK
jgi:hypothetical protein